MSRILALDDEEIRHREFARRFAGHDLVQARTVAEAIAALRGARFDLVTLDHDLGSGDGTGRDVADFIATLPIESRPRFAAVHSFNPVGARAMVSTLKAARVPSHHRPFRVGEAA